MIEFDRTLFEPEAPPAVACPHCGLETILYLPGQDKIRPAAPPPPISSLDSDLLSNKVLAAYFSAREHEVYFHSLRYVDERRSFCPRIVAALEDLLGFFDDAPNLELLDACVFRRRQKVEKTGQRVEEITEGLKILDRLMEVDNQGVELLELTATARFGSLTAAFDSLKSAYRSAAKKYHPDVGGSNELMRLVNDAFNQFHEIISRWHWTEAPTRPDVSEAPLGPTVGHPGFEFEIRSATEYLNWLGVILVTIHTDSWAVDKAHSVLKSLSDHGLLSQRFTHDESFLAYLARPLFRLAERLHTARLAEEARFVQNHAFELLTRESHIYPNVDLGKALGQTRASSVLCGDEKLMVVIKHPCQAENLLRLGVIDKDRYCQAQTRFQRQHAKTVSKESDFARFQESGGFTSPLSYDVPCGGYVGTETLVPVPTYFGVRINHVSDAQRAEYFRAFGPLGSREMVEKYLPIRISSYLCSLIHSFSVEEAPRIEHECKLLQGLFPESLYALKIVQEVSEHICGLDSNSRRQKLSLLQKLDTPEKRDNVDKVTVSAPEGEGRAEAHIPIEATIWYIRVVKASVDRLRTALETGRVGCSSEETREQEEWNRDMRFIHSLNQTSVAARAHEAEWHHRQEPEKLIDAVIPHIQQLLEAAKSVAPQNKGHLSPYYHIDAVSAALVKLKRWEEARYWLELFFSLDAVCQQGPASDRAKMLKRFARCKAELAKKV
jgi:hypothetical protein